MISLLVFWSSVILILYTYVVFPLLVLARGRLLPRPFRCSDATPFVSVVIAAHNEEAHIAARIENLLGQDYALERLQILVTSDGSDDGTDEIVRGYRESGVELVTGPRQGKGQALNRAISRATGEILVFSDANTHFRPDAIRALVRPFADPQVGGVAGNQVYTRDDQESLSAGGEMAYWDFDRMLKEAQSRAGSVTSATGAIYAIRRELYHPVPLYAMDDFVISTGVVAGGGRLVFAADAVAVEPVAARAEAEFGRKVRVITQGLYAVRVMRELLNPFRYGLYSHQLAWHKILRRAMVLPLLAILAASPWLWLQGTAYQLIVLAQLAFYGLAAAGFVLHEASGRSSKLAALPFYFCMVNAAALIAILRNLSGRHIGTWTPSHEMEAGDSDA